MAEASSILSQHWVVTLFFSAVLPVSGWISESQHSSSFSDITQTESKMIPTHLTHSISPPQVCPLCSVPPTHHAHLGFKGKARKVEGPYVLDLTRTVIICPLKCGRWPNTGCLSPGAFLWGSWKPHWAQPTLIPCLPPLTATHLTSCRSGPLPSARFIPGGLVRQRYELPTTFSLIPVNVNLVKSWKKTWKTPVKAQDDRPAVYISWSLVPPTGIKWYLTLLKVQLSLLSSDPTVIGKRGGVLVCVYSLWGRKEWDTTERLYLLTIFVININTPCINENLVRLTLECVPPECYRKVRNWLAIVSSGYTSEFYCLHC